MRLREGKAPSKPSPAPECNLPRIPDALWGKILGYLSDGDKFKLRRANTVFYNAYYGQKVTDRSSAKFNVRRAASLARRGRVFTKVRHLELDQIDRKWNAWAAYS